MSVIAATMIGPRTKVPNAIGAIHSDDFSSNTIGDYTTSFAAGSASISGGNLNLAGGAALWSNDYVAFNKSGSAHTQTNLNSWTQVVTFKCGNVPAGSTYGFGLGILSTNTQVPVSLWAWFRMDNDPTGQGKVYINSRSNTTNTFVHTGGTAVRVQNNDEYRLTVTVTDNQIFYTIVNITNSNQTYSSFYTFLFTAAATTMNNTGRFAMCLLGGTQQVHDWVITSTALIQNTKVCFVGNSIVYGCYSGSGSNSRWPLKAMQGSSSAFTINSGSADYTQSIVNKLSELVALTPTFVVLMVGGNDLQFGISSGTWQANYTNVVNTLKASGIQVIHCYATPRNSTNVTSLNSWISSTFTTDVIVDTYTPLWSGSGTSLHATYDSGDGVHPNSAGHNLIATTVITAAPFLR